MIPNQEHVETLSRAIRSILRAVVDVDFHPSHVPEHQLKTVKHAAFLGTKESVKGGQNVLLDEHILAFDRAGLAIIAGLALVVRAPLEAFMVDEERVAQDVELVIEDTHLVG